MTSSSFAPNRPARNERVSEIAPSGWTGTLTATPSRSTNTRRTPSSPLTTAEFSASMTGSRGIRSLRTV